MRGPPEAVPPDPFSLFIFNVFCDTIESVIIETEGVEMKILLVRAISAGLKTLLLLVSTLALVSVPATEAQAQPDYLSDRGEGVSLSMFGTYIEQGQFIIYPFVEYYKDKDMEYDPGEFGYGPEGTDYFGEYEASEALIFLGYGLTDDIALEFEAAVIDARLDKDSSDSSGMPDRIEESGLGDVEGQVRWRFARESESRPEVFTYFETVLPSQKDKLLIGTSDWEFKLGFGVIKGFEFGTITIRLAAAYDRAEDESEFGEYAIEYLKRISDKHRVFLMIEGEQDEVEFVPEWQWHVRSDLVVKGNLGFALTPKATDFAPEFGVMFIF